MKCTIWITAMVQSYESIIITELVNKGYTISAANIKGKVAIQTKNNAGCVIALIVDKASVNHKDICDDIYDILKLNKMMFYSLIISETSSNSIWQSSNICYSDYIENINQKKELN